MIAIPVMLAVGLLAPSSPPTEAPASALRLQTVSPKTHAASLLAAVDPDALPSAHRAMIADVERALRSELSHFERYLASTDAASDWAGGGDYEADGALIFVAGLLGFIPGFGLGHLISGHIGGFVAFLIIDLVLGGVFFGVFPVISWALWYVPGVVVFIVERTVEAILAANAASRPRIYADMFPKSKGFADAAAPVSSTLPVFSF